MSQPKRRRVSASSIKALLQCSLVQNGSVGECIPRYVWLFPLLPLRKSRPTLFAGLLSA